LVSPLRGRPYDVSRMVAIKNADADSFIARPDPARPIVLVYGADAGLVRERAEKLIGVSVDDPRDPFSVARLDGDTLASEPGRLAEEAHTVPLFGGRRAVWVKAGSRNFAAAIDLVVTTPPKDCRIVIEAGDLRRNAPVRAICEKAKCTAAIACYVDNERDLARLVDEEMRGAKLTITADARTTLIALIGGDRRASRSEISKLALYAHGKSEVTLDDVFAVVADASALALDDIVDAAFSGQPAELETQLGKALAAGTGIGTIMWAAQRQVMQLHKAKLAAEQGASVDEALGVFIPPVHFRRRQRVEAALKAWTAARLERAMLQLADTTLDVRRNYALSDTIGRRALLVIAQAGRRAASI
jgi:DNA polymerase-3 subunit delta